MPGKAVASGPATIPIDRDYELTPLDRMFLRQLQRRALGYFLENQAACGLILDRQRNRGPRQEEGLCSTSATGMGLIALALASAPPHRLLSRDEAIARIRAALTAARDWLPEDQGILPHFAHSATGAVSGSDAFATIDTAWLLAGALWGAAFLRDPTLESMADQLFDRVDWSYWAAPPIGDPDGPRLLSHGKRRDGRFLGSRWDRLNGETVFLYVLASGADDRRVLPTDSWEALRPFHGTVAGRRFPSADLGLFVFQYGLDLLDLSVWRAPGGEDLVTGAEQATAANVETCRELAPRFATYRQYWGLSAGDGPGAPPAPDAYRAYAPGGPIDGTAHLTATLASVAHRPGAVLENLQRGRCDDALTPLGRYGFSNVNADHGWVGRDMVAIDAGAAVLALENVLGAGRIRKVFHGLPRVARGLDRLGFARTAARRAS